MSAPAPAACTFQPGHRSAKLAVLAASLAFAAFGFWELSWPAARLWRGTRTEAEVITVIERRAGLPERRYGSGHAIEGDPARAAVFLCEAAFRDAGNRPRTAILNVASQVAPPFLPGDRILVSYTDDPTAPALAVADWRTWTPGSFLATAGMCFVLVSASLFAAASRPINCPPDSRLP